MTEARTDWRLCSKCQSLFLPEGLTSVEVSGGACPADYLGGPHRSASGITYTVSSVPMQSRKVVGQWDLCRKCFSLYSIADTEKFGVCPGNTSGEGAYLPHESDHAEERASMTFDLRAGSEADEQQNGWQLCDTCLVLFYAEGPSAPICPGSTGGAHKSASGVEYSVTLGDQK